MLARENGDGSWAVAYDDGDAEGAVPAALIAIRAAAGEFAPGDAVEARFEGGPRYYPGEVVADNGDGSYEVRYDDGDWERAARFVRAAPAARAPAAAPPAARGADARRERLEDCVRRSRERGSGGGAGGDALGACEGLGTFELDARTAATLRGVFDAIVAAVGARGGGAPWSGSASDRRTKRDAFPPRGVGNEA